MTTSNIVLQLVIIAVFLLGYIARRAPELPDARGGKVLLGIGLLVLPALVLITGVGASLKRSTSTDFCLSCHEMRNYGKSLLINDNEPIPAVHFQNRFVPRNRACYTCHADYAMFGDVKTKINGLRHLYYHYLAGVPAPIKIAAPYPNRNCLTCHAGARSFVESENHHTDEVPFDKIVSGEGSCLASGCHDSVHATGNLDDYELWSIPDPTQQVDSSGKEEDSNYNSEEKADE